MDPLELLEEARKFMALTLETVQRIESKVDGLIENEKKLEKEREEVTEMMKNSPFGQLLEMAKEGS